MRIRNPLPIVILIVSLVGPSASAGQLFVDEFPLAEPARSGPVYLGRVVELDAKAGTLKFEILRLWHRGKEVSEAEVTRVKNEVRKGETWASQFDQKVKTHEQLAVKVYQGIEWTDPGESPIDRRLAGRASLTDFKVGDRILVVGTDGCEVMKPSKKVLKELAELAKTPDPNAPKRSPN